MVNCSQVQGKAGTFCSYFLNYQIIGNLPLQFDPSAAHLKVVTANWQHLHIHQAEILIPYSHTSNILSDLKKLVKDQQITGHHTAAGR